VCRLQPLVLISASALLCVASACGGGSPSSSSRPETSSSSATTAGAGGGQSGAGGGQPTPTKTSLVHTLDVAGQASQVITVTVKPDDEALPPRAKCSVTGTAYYDNGSRSRRVGPGGLDLTIDDNPENTKWEVSCTASDPSEPGGVWQGQGEKCLASDGSEGDCSRPSTKPPTSKPPQEPSASPSSTPSPQTPSPSPSTT
jgi:hypothetical protein